MSKKTLILGGVFIALLIAAFAYDPILKWKDGLGKPVNFLAKAGSFSEVNKIDITKDGVTIALEKDDKGWRVAATKGFYVKENLINDIKSSFEEAAEGDLELVSTNKDRKSDFKTGDEGILVKFFSNENLKGEMVVGMAGGDFASSYVSKTDISETYLAKGNLNRAFAHDAWYDKEIFASEAAKISKIRFQYPTREFTVQRDLPTAGDEAAKMGDWKGVLPYKFNVNQEKISKVLDIMSNLEAVEIPAQKFEGTGLEKHLMIIEATGEGVNNVLMVGNAVDDKAENKKYYAKKGDSDNIYLISGAQKDELDKTIIGLK